jgi:hypothetical protein
MAVKEIKNNGSIEVTPKEFLGLTADTAAWQAANVTVPEGSTLKELDGTKKKYQLHDGTWYDITAV